MSNIIEDLWYGRLKPFEKCISASDDAKELDDYIARHKRVLSEIMTDEQKAIFEKLMNCYEELSNINERLIFTYSFKLGAQLAVETVD
ncbi:MAG: hypothetical protein IJA41_11100 [Clostridia bacterium]|nr:hypothetical protein [Clostridia bacterium]